MRPAGHDSAAQAQRTVHRGTRPTGQYLLKGNAVRLNCPNEILPGSGRERQQSSAAVLSIADVNNVPSTCDLDAASAGDQQRQVAADVDASFASPRGGECIPQAPLHSEQYTDSATTFIRRTHAEH